MNKERIEEIKEILFNEHLHCYLPNICNELLRHIDRLNNIINSLEKWLEETMKKYKLPLVEQNKGALGFTLPIQDTYQQVLDKLKALKEEK